MKQERPSITRKVRKFKMSSAITCTLKGNFKKTNSFLQKCLEFIKLGRLDYFGRIGVEQLAKYTPKDTGLAASSWFYKIEREPGRTRLEWHNSDIEGGCNVAILIAYGHGTRNGVYVPGVDYITPALKPVIFSIVESMREEIRAL